MKMDTTLGNSPNITSYDVAREAGVSIGTVSRVLSNQPNVDKELRSRVLKAIDLLGYVHVPKKRRAVPKIHLTEPLPPENETKKPEKLIKNVMLCVPVRKTPALQTSYFYQMLNTAQAECARRKIALMYSVVEDGPGALPQLDEAIQAGNADGILLINFGASELVQGLYERGVPVVMIDPRQYPRVPIDVITNDAQDATMIAMEHLIGLGHRNIALINGPKRYGMQHRQYGYEIVLREAGLPVRPELITRNELTSEGGENAMLELLERRVDFSALFCANHYMAFGAIRVLQNAGKRIPEDVSVVGYGELEPSELYNWPLTSINDHNELKGRLAIRYLLERTANSHDLPIRITLPVELIVRGTTAPNNPGNK
jgi:DNA-binding LacI/PurR family transcriptional regulator